MRIALVGSASSSVSIAPYEDKSYAEFKEGLPAGFPGGGIMPENFLDETWEIWGCSPGAAGMVRRATRWFEVHRWEPGKNWFQPAYCEFVRDFKGPVYVGGNIPEIKNQVLYPIDRVETTFSAYFLTSSLALMCALAILEILDARDKDPNHNHSDDVIGFFGVDMSAGEEYGYQRAGCQFFILEALRRGIGVYVPPESCLLRPMPVYGLCEWGHTYIKLTQRARELNASKAQAAQQFEEARNRMTALAGSMEDLNYMVNTWTSPYGLPPGEVIRLTEPAKPKPDEPTGT